MTNTPEEAEQIFNAYSEWLANERKLLHYLRFGDDYRETLKVVPVTAASNFHFPPREGQQTPAERAAAVLAFVGASWRETDPDEITLTMPDAGEDDEPLPTLSEAELDVIFAEDGTAYDFSIQSSIAAHQSAWRELVALKEIVAAAMADGPFSRSQKDTLHLLESLDGWFMHSIDRLAAMAAMHALRDKGSAT